MPFLSIVVNSLAIRNLRSLQNWFGKRWVGLTQGWEELDRDKVAFLADLWPNQNEAVTKLLRHLDTGVGSFEWESNASEGEKDQIWVWHTANGHRTRWSLAEESTGTQRLFVLAYKILTCLEQGTLLLIDELGSNIHPNITRAIVRLFQNPETNPKRAQLIFTSHDNTLQRGNLLRRDQIWFTQKRTDGSTDLYPLTDFHPRNDLALDKAYLDGRFGAVPLLPPDEELLGMPATAGTAG